MYTLGYDIGSSSVKCALIYQPTGKTVHLAAYPKTEMRMIANQPGWAEQDTEEWWHAVCMVTNEIFTTAKLKPRDIKSIGISYQMHGLVLVSKDYKVLRPAIIWCDSRAVAIGDEAFKNLGEDYCLNNFLNSPGNFTASKLRWVQENEPEIYSKIHKILLPGDYIAMRLTGEIVTTVPGLSEGIFWNFKEKRLATEVLEYYSIDPSMIPERVDTFGIQGKVCRSGSTDSGIPIGVPVSYRAGDQPNNAMSLNVLDPGEIAATGGTSGVVYGVSDKIICDNQSRINGFAHVNHSDKQTRIGQLMCINGAGSQYAWIKKQISQDHISYQDMELEIENISVGSDGLSIIPFGNGAERLLHNNQIGAHICNIQFNIHQRAHIYRAALEGIAFSFVYGLQLMDHLGIKSDTIRVGNDNLFQSDVFSQTISNLLNCTIEMMDTTGAIGAANASGIATGYYNSIREINSQIRPIHTYIPMTNNDEYLDAYDRWKSTLLKFTN